MRFSDQTIYECFCKRPFSEWDAKTNRQFEDFLKEEDFKAAEGHIRNLVATVSFSPDADFQECLQDFKVHLLKQVFPKFDPARGTFKPRLIFLATLRTLDCLRKIKRWQGRTDMLPDEQVDPDSPGTQAACWVIEGGISESTWPEIEQNLAQTKAELFATLPPEDRDFLEFLLNKKFEGLKMEELAKARGKSYDAFRKQLSRICHTYPQIGEWLRQAGLIKKPRGPQAKQDSSSNDDPTT